MRNYTFFVICIIIYLKFLCVFKVDGSDQKWEVRYDVKSSPICILIKFSAKLVVNPSTNYQIPAIDTDLQSGTCDYEKRTAHFELQWPGKNGKNSKFVIYFNSTGSKDEEEVVVDKIIIVLNEDNILNDKEFKFNDKNELKVFDIKQKYSYKCKDELSIVANTEKSDQNVKLEFSDVQWEVFRHKDDKKVEENEFINTPKKCEGDVQMSKSAPIIAGIVMACLVVVVVGFLVFGRIRYRRLPDKY